jgi:hypothetical protein
MAALTMALANAWWFHAVLSRRMADWDTAADVPFVVSLSGYFSVAMWVAILAAGRLIGFVSSF